MYLPKVNYCCAHKQDMRIIGANGTTKAKQNEEEERKKKLKCVQQRKDVMIEKFEKEINIQLFQDSNC